MVPTLLGISVLCFALIHLAPGDPALVRAEVATDRKSTRLNSSH